MLRIHHPPEGEATVSDFSVCINGEETSPWFCRVSAMPYNTVWPGYQRPLEQTEAASFISFEMDEPVRVRLVAARDFERLDVRPLHRNIRPSVSGRVIEFTLSECGQYTVELDGWHGALHIFANPVSDFGVDKSDPNVLYFAPGVHETGEIELCDNQTLFVDGGAVIYGSVTAFHKKNVRVVGYGVIDGSREKRTSDTKLITSEWDEPIDMTDEKTLRDFIADRSVLRGCVHLYSCQDCEIAGVIARDSATFAYIIANCDRVNCEWFKTIGMWRYNSDGIDLFNSRYVRIAHGFLRDFDDCIVLKGIKGWDCADLHHIFVTGCTVWCDWGSALEIGAETCADSYHDVLWEDCDVIHAEQVFMRIHNSDRAHIYNVLYKNIRCEYSRYDVLPVYQHDMSAPFDSFRTHGEPHLIDSPVYDGPYSNDHILGHTSDVRFEDIYVYAPDGLSAPLCTFGGQDEAHCNRNIVIDGVILNGRRLKPEEIALEKSECCDITIR